ncbi:stage III sporulation protein AE [Candidatus Arthromitus sp. SFB-turkey]|uniref:stage III sporulation protein AE n=1 Tax=Candidatus Arthromitus sp. SFB-turkey TaxID=1840217 RepID=UPI0007F552EA|nr:stage III sporulation protein AE [Candidatus Arthromitus sp. SFB-turkey]OAT86902.1 stage III sporulation protein AE [Candidatus Arthromitus sp. SFB-turkey]HJD00159.1 stage III sporulation protein AE [Candidatus Dwaynia gallinarum]
MVKKIFLCLVLLTLFLQVLSFNISSATENNDQSSIENIIQENEKEISNLYEYIINMKDDIEILKDLDPKEYVKSLMTHGTEEVSISKTIFKNIISFILREVVLVFNGISTVIIIAVICALIQNLQTAFSHQTLSNVAFYACYALLIIILSKTFLIGIDIAKETINELNNFLLVLIPVLSTLLLSAGGVSQVATLDPIIILLTNIGPTFYLNILIPIILLGFMLQFANNISNNFKISNLIKHTNQIVLWAQGIFITFFISMLTIRGFTAESLDIVTAKTAKFAVDNFVPIVGKAISEAIATVAGYSILLKNAVSSLGLIIVIAIVLVPIIKIFIMATMYRLTAAIIEPISDNRIVSAISSVGDSLILIMSCVIVVSVLFFVMISIIASAGKLIIGV